MKKMTGVRLYNRSRYASRRGMALAVSLIVLLVAGMMVGVSMYLVENMMGTTQMKINDEVLLNAALSGVEKGKELLFQKKETDKALPRRSDPETGIAGADLKPPFDVLKVDVGGTTFTTPEGVQVDFVVYDLDYSIEEGEEIPDFEKGIPPIITFVSGGGGGGSSDIEATSSQASWQSYTAINRSGGPYDNDPVEGAGSIASNAYLVRSTATYKEFSKTVEQAIALVE